MDHTDGSVSVRNTNSVFFIFESLATMASSFPLAYRPATSADAPLIAALVNSAYRGDSSRAGWTTEADLISGARTDEGEIRRLLAESGSMILLCLQAGEIIGSVHLKQTDAASAYLGLFVVRPTLQGGGIGKEFIQAAERAAQERFGITRMWMTVISVRPELIAYYERRGYRRTGELKPFPKEAGASVPQVENLQLEVLEKHLGELETPNDVESG
jgi:GNAT superfamily N-acetyltransferase